MAHSTLVSFDVDAGRELLSTLDHAGLNMDVALWAFMADYDDPRLVLAGKQLDQTHVSKAIQSILEVVRTTDEAQQRMPLFLVYRMKEPFIQDLRRMFSKTTTMNGMRLGGQSFGGRYIEDAYVYRIR